MQYNTTTAIPRNNFFSQNSNISSQTVVGASEEIDVSEFCNSQISKSNHYEIVEQLLKSRYIKPRHANYLKTVIRFSNHYLVSHASMLTIANEMGVTERTIVNISNEMQNVGLIHKEKRGWKQTNITSLKVVQHVLNHKSENFSHILQFITNLINISNINNNNYRNDFFKNVDNFNEYEKLCDLPSSRGLSGKKRTTKNKIIEDLKDTKMSYRQKQIVASKVINLKLSQRCFLGAIRIMQQAKEKVLLRSIHEEFNETAYLLKVLDNINTNNEKIYQNSTQSKSNSLYSGLEKKTKEMLRTRDNENAEACRMPESISIALSKIGFKCH